MIYAFLTDNDLDLGMKRYFREQVMEFQNQHVLKTAEGAAFSLIKTKLNNRYDLTKLFPTIKEWGSGTHNVNEFVYYQGSIYKCIANATNQPPTDTAYWVQEDPRDQLLVVYAVRITIFFFLESISPRKINADVNNDFAGAVEELDAIKSGEENPDWPLIENSTSKIQWGSNPKQNHYY